MEYREKELLDRLYEEYSKNLYLMAKYRLGEEKAKDAVQMVFLVAALRMEQLYSHENKKLWLYQTMQNVIKQLLYDKKYTKDGQRREILTDEIEERGYLEQYEFEDLGIIADLQGILREREYQYIVERFVHEKTHQELAEVFDLSYSGVTSFGDRVLRKTKKFLEKTRKNENETR